VYCRDPITRAAQTADATRYERRALWTGVMIGSVVAGIPFTLVAASQGGKYPEGVAVIWLVIAAAYLVAFVASRLHKPRGRE
jgi:Mg/Co/Ni transporter MgtE